MCASGKIRVALKKEPARELAAAIPCSFGTSTCSQKGYGYDESINQHGAWTNAFLSQGLERKRSSGGRLDMVTLFQDTYNAYVRDHPSYGDRPCCFLSVKGQAYNTNNLSDPSKLPRGVVTAGDVFGTRETQRCFPVATAVTITEPEGTETTRLSGCHKVGLACGPGECPGVLHERRGTPNGVPLPPVAGRAARHRGVLTSPPIFFFLNAPRSSHPHWIAILAKYASFPRNFRSGHPEGTSSHRMPRTMPCSSQLQEL